MAKTLDEKPAAIDQLIRLCKEYPSKKLRNKSEDKIATYLEVDRERITIGAGVDDLINTVTLWHKSIHSSGAEIRSGSMSFSQFYLAAKRHNVEYSVRKCQNCDKVVNIDLEKQNTIKNMIKLVWHTKGYHLENQGSPDCTDLEDRNTDNTAINAIDYTPVSLLQFKSEIANGSKKKCLLLFSLSKFFDIPGARIGVLVGPSNIIYEIKTMQVPYPIATTSLIIANEIFNKNSATHTKCFRKAIRSFDSKINFISQITIITRLIQKYGITAIINPYSILLINISTEIMNWIKRQCECKKIDYWHGKQLEYEVSFVKSSMIRIKTNSELVNILHELLKRLQMEESYEHRSKSCYRMRR